MRSRFSPIHITLFILTLIFVGSAQAEYYIVGEGYASCSGGTTNPPCYNEVYTSGPCGNVHTVVTHDRRPAPPVDTYSSINYVYGYWLNGVWVNYNQNIKKCSHHYARYEHRRRCCKHRCYPLDLSTGDDDPCRHPGMDIDE